MTTLGSLEDKSGNLCLQICNYITKNEAMLKICPEMFKELWVLTKIYM